MTKNKMVRPAMTAIAAVIALATPSFAQGPAEPIAVTSAPAIVTADPLAPTPVAAAPAAADPLVPDAPAKPAIRKPTAAKSTAPRPPSEAALPAGAAPMLSKTNTMISDPDAAAPVELAAQTEAAPVQAPVAGPSALADTNTSGSMLPIAGAGALGIAALFGAGLVMSRRRRRADDADADARRALAGTATDEEGVMMVEPEPEPATPAETAAVAAAVEAAHEPSPEIDGPVTELPEDFDVSKFGLHTQAAYNGPTEDNPSLSLKHRLSRAAGMDQMAEREAEAEVAAEAV